MERAEEEHYFDWAATSPPDRDIISSAMEKAYSCWGNPSSAHRLGREARLVEESAREECAKSLGVEKDTIYFTSGGTESNHIVLSSELNRMHKGAVLVSAIEHPALREGVKALKQCGIKVVTIMPNKDGVITAQAVMEKVEENTTLVCVMAVNNETGVIEPINEIAEALSKKGGRHIHLHADCVQAAGKVPLSLCGIDSAAFSAHKICGPRGIGILYLSHTYRIEPFLRGGGQESGIRSGTENVAGAIAAGKCLMRYTIGRGNNDADRRYKEQCVLTRTFIERIIKIPSCRIIPESRGEMEIEEERKRFSPWIVQAAFMGIPGPVMLRALDDKGFYISTGSACSSKKDGRPVLAAMSVMPEVRECAVRFSFGAHTTERGMDELCSAVYEVVSRFR